MAVDVTTDAATLLKLLGEPLRWEIVQRLAVEDLCTCQLVGDLSAAQPLISHHLGVLRKAGVVTSEKVGAYTYYSLDRGVIGQLSERIGELAVDRRAARRRPCT